jgi:hypothetical protein
MATFLWFALAAREPKVHNEGTSQSRNVKPVRRNEDLARSEYLNLTFNKVICAQTRVAYLSHYTLRAFLRMGLISCGNIPKPMQPPLERTS